MDTVKSSCHTLDEVTIGRAMNNPGPHFRVGQKASGRLRVHVTVPAHECPTRYEALGAEYAASDVDDQSVSKCHMFSLIR